MKQNTPSYILPPDPRVSSDAAPLLIVVAGVLMLVVIILAMTAYLGTVAKNDALVAENRELTAYCEMRKINIDSNGEWGWPNWDPAREAECPWGDQ